MKKILSKFILWITGWKIVGSREYPKKCIVIAAPHTSNWDFLFGRCYGYIIGIRAKYLIKSELFIPILGTLFRWDGGIPVYRRNVKNNVVEQISQLYSEQDELIVGITPEGTRKRVDAWKTGFYRIANKSNIPILLFKLDYKLKEMGVVDKIFPSGNMSEDMLRIQKNFQNITGKIENNYNPKIF